MRISLVFAASVVLGLIGCSSDSTSPSEPAIVASQKQRLTTPDIPAADAEALRAGNTAFASDLYQDLAKANVNANFAFSPYSISLALAMTYAGAAGNTATQIASTMHFTLPPAQLHNAFDGLDLALTSRGQGAAGTDGAPFKLTIANSMWGAPQTTFLAPFLDTLAVDYGAPVRLTDFAANPDAARSTINGWVDTTTEHRISQLLGPGTIDDETRFVLVNAIYFNAKWKFSFDKSSTTPGTFHGATGDGSAPFMSQMLTTPYAKGTGYQAISLPYDGDQLSLVAVMPDSLSSFEGGLTADQAQTIATSLAPTQLQLSMPKFKIEGSPISLKTMLSARGMTDAFNRDLANLTGMSSEPLSISDVVHQAMVDVDESGTVAAAATAVVGVTDLAVAIPNVTLTLDHPFLFFIRDNQTGAVVFLGRVAQL